MANLLPCAARGWQRRREGLCCHACGKHTRPPGVTLFFLLSSLPLLLSFPSSTAASRLSTRHSCGQSPARCRCCSTGTAAWRTTTSTTTQRQAPGGSRQADGQARERQARERQAREGHACVRMVHRPTGWHTSCLTAAASPPLPSLKALVDPSRVFPVHIHYSAVCAGKQQGGGFPASLACALIISAQQFATHACCTAAPCAQARRTRKRRPACAGGPACPSSGTPRVVCFRAQWAGTDSRHATRPPLPPGRHRPSGCQLLQKRQAAVGVQQAAALRLGAPRLRVDCARPQHAPPADTARQPKHQPHRARRLAVGSSRRPCLIDTRCRCPHARMLARPPPVNARACKGAGGAGREGPGPRLWRPAGVAVPAPGCNTVCGLSSRSHGTC